MTKQKSTKRALLLSALSLLMCVSMLIGSTFAWFTDSVTSGNNKIVSGNLDVVLEYKTDWEDTWASVNENTKIFKEDALYEPGYTEVVFLRVSNAGSLALKYNLMVNIIGEKESVNVNGDKFKLSDHLQIGTYYQDEYSSGANYADILMPALFGTREAALNKVNLTKLSEANSIVRSDAPVLAGEQTAQVIAIVLTMPETVGNEANYDIAYEAPEIQLGVSLVATQYTDERDSFDNQYDKDAEYPKFADTWDGTADTSWYNDTDTEFTLDTAEQLAGLAKLVDGGNTFEGKTIKLNRDFDLYTEDENGEAKCFDPIGSYRMDKIFEGTFDGQNHTIANMSQNTWALGNGYYYTDCGLGLFGAVENATIKNLVMDNASISGESALCGTIAAVAGDDVIFENIKVTNSEVADYQYYAGGIVGWAGGDEQFINCVIDASTTIGAQWGDFNNASGGVIGGVSTSAAILMKDCTVACRIDGFNDVTSAYEWYSYRRSGMLIGDSGQMDDPDGNNIGNAIAPNLTCENVTVIYGNWANYHYCKFNAMSYPWVRVEAGTSTGAYSNPRYGHPTDANGNEVVDENHTHNDGEAHNELIVFDQLYGGATGDRYCTYGAATHDGVTVIYNNK